MPNVFTQTEILRPEYNLILQVVPYGSEPPACNCPRQGTRTSREYPRAVGVDQTNKHNAYIFVLSPCESTLVSSSPAFKEQLVVFKPPVVLFGRRTFQSHTSCHFRGMLVILCSVDEPRKNSQLFIKCESTHESCRTPTRSTAGWRPVWVRGWAAQLSGRKRGTAIIK